MLKTSIKTICVSSLFLSNSVFCEYDNEKYSKYKNELYGSEFNKLFPNFVPMKVIKKGDSFYKKNTKIDLHNARFRNHILKTGILIVGCETNISENITVKTDFVDITDIKNKIYGNEELQIVLFKIPYNATISVSKSNCASDMLEVVDIKEIYNCNGLETSLKLNGCFANCVKVLFENDDIAKKEMFNALSDNEKIMYICMDPLYVKSIAELDEELMFNVNHQLKIIKT